MDHYGITFYDVKYKESRSRLGVSPKGISIYQGIRRLELHDWLTITEVSFKGKKITLTLKDKNVSILRTPGFYLGREKKLPTPNYYKCTVFIICDRLRGKGPNSRT